MKLHLGCSDDLRRGFMNVDIAPPEAVTMIAGTRCGRTADGISFAKADLNGEWPFADNSCDEIVANDVLEHLHGHRPGNGGKIHVMNQAWRVLKPGGLLRMTVPCFALADGRVNPGAVADPTHCTWWTWDDQFYFSEQFHNQDGERGRLGEAYGIKAVFRFPQVVEMADSTWRGVASQEHLGLSWYVREDAGGARTKLVGVIQAVK